MRFMIHHPLDTNQRPRNLVTDWPADRRITASGLIKQTAKLLHSRLRGAVLGTAVLASIFAGSATPCTAATFDLPEGDTTVVGSFRVVLPSSDNTLVDIARHFDVGHHEITWANPGVSVWLPGNGGKVVVPTQFILPQKPWEGVVLNIPQRRLFYFPKPKKGETAKVITYPVSIAREGWSTPLGKTTIVGKYKDPAWFVPPSIRKEKFEEGEVDFPTYFPPGPNNPMGMLAIQTGFPGIFIHGTNRPWGVGMRVSHGCLHLYPEDAAEIFPSIEPGTPVRVVDEPFVVGVLDDRLVMASYQTVLEYESSDTALTRAISAFAPFLDAGEDGHAANRAAYNVDWKLVEELIKSPHVLPVDVTVGARRLAEKIARTEVELFDWPPYDIDANDARAPGKIDDTSLNAARND